MAAAPKRTRRRSPRLPDAVLPAPLLADAYERSVGIVVHAFARLGLSPTDLSRGLKNVPCTVRDQPKLADYGSRYRRLAQLTAVMAAWHDTPAYLDETGRPRSLPRDGEDSFAALCRRTVPDEVPELIAEELLGTGNLRLLPNGSLQPVRGHTDLPYLGQMQLDRLQVCLHDLFANLLYNHTDRGKAPRRVDREVTELEVPIRDVADFDDALKRHATLFTEQVNQWLLLRVRKRKPSEPTARVSVHVFAAVEPNPVPTKRATRGKSRRREP